MTTRSKELEKLWPEYFQEKQKEKILLLKCKSLLQNIERRYNIECNTKITRKQVTEIGKLIIEINKNDNP